MSKNLIIGIVAGVLIGYYFQIKIAGIIPIPSANV